MIRATTSDRVEPEPPNFEEEIGSEDEILKPYEETEDGKAEAIVQGILDEWLRRKCGVEGGVVFCDSATNSCVYVQRMEEGLGAPRC
jgi:hypothetical protein